jgi:pimeloyl-ACP methyl ester carboxylesterase
VTVLLLHALPLDPRMWAGQRDALAAADPVAPTLYELPGETMDEWAESLLVGIEGRFVAVGASMGGYLALALARSAPERTAGVILVGSRAEPDPPERRAARDAQLRALEVDGAAGLWELMRPALFAPDADPGLVEAARAIALAQDPGGLARAVRAIRDRPDARDVLRSLGDRALVVLGEADPIAPPGEVFAPGDAVVLPGCGHLPALEQPEQVSDLLAGAVARWT